MISRLKFLFSLACLSLLVSATGYANGQNPQDGEAQQPAQEAKEDSLGIYDEEYKVNDPFMLEDQFNISQEAIVPESTTTPAPKQQTAKVTVQEEEDENSAMSFNFIYYIIDKFKLADPLD